jgi:hypothetical protein
MARIVPLLALALVLACGAPETAPPSSGRTSAALSQGATRWESTLPEDFPFPMDCLDEMFEFTGLTHWGTLVTPMNGGDYIVKMTHTYDPPMFTSLSAPFDTWSIAPGYASENVEHCSTTNAACASAAFPADDPFSLGAVRAEWFEHIPMVNDRTGQKEVLRFKLMLDTDAAGDIKVFRVYFTCFKP